MNHRGMAAVAWTYDTGMLGSGDRLNAATYD